MESSRYRVGKFGNATTQPQNYPLRLRQEKIISKTRCADAPTKPLTQATATTTTTESNLK